MCVCVLTAGRLGRVSLPSSLFSWEEERLEPSVLTAWLPEQKKYIKNVVHFRNQNLFYGVWTFWKYICF